MNNLVRRENSGGAATLWLNRPETHCLLKRASRSIVLGEWDRERIS